MHATHHTMIGDEMGRASGNTKNIKSNSRRKQEKSTATLIIARKSSYYPSLSIHFPKTHTPRCSKPHCRDLLSLHPHPSPRWITLSYHAVAGQGSDRRILKRLPVPIYIWKYKKMMKIHHRNFFREEKKALKVVNGK